MKISVTEIVAVAALFLSPLSTATTLDLQISSEMQDEIMLSVTSSLGESQKAIMDSIKKDIEAMNDNISSVKNKDANYERPAHLGNKSIDFSK